MKRIHISDLTDSMNCYLDSITVDTDSLNLPLKSLSPVFVKSVEVLFEEKPLEISVVDIETSAQKHSKYLKEVNRLNSRKLKTFITIKSLEEKTIAEMLEISIGTLHNYINNSCRIPSKKAKMLNEKFALGLEIVEKNVKNNVA